MCGGRSDPISSNVFVQFFVGSKDGAASAESPALSVRELLKQALECDHTRNWFALRPVAAPASAPPSAYVEVSFKFTTFQHKNGVPLSETTVVCEGSLRLLCCCDGVLQH
jgi:hypothetical protein